MKKPQRVAVIMAGGSGERFWPLSRRRRPKQLLNLTSEKETLLAEAVNRIVPLLSPADVFVATSRELAPVVRRAGLGIPPENVLAEPARRNTAGCLSWVAAELRSRHRDGDVSIAVLTADHMIGRPERFRMRVAAALSAAEKHDAIVTIGVRPTRPETGYGYIEVSPGKYRGPTRPVARFREKPNRELAEEFLASGRHYWNSGMFFYRLSVFCREMTTASPLHGAAIDRMAGLLPTRRRAAEGVFRRLEDISIDYALMEHTPHVLMIEANFPWDDVGAWDALDRSRRSNDQGNIISGDAVVLESARSIILNEAGSRIAVGVVGAEDLIVIVEKDAVLVVPKHRAQDVRLIARELKKRKARQV